MQHKNNTYYCELCTKRNGTFTNHYYTSKIGQQHYSLQYKNIVQSVSEQQMKRMINDELLGQHEYNKIALDNKEFPIVEKDFKEMSQDEKEHKEILEKYKI